MNTEKQKVQGLLLENLWDLCYRAHYNTSFSPDRRATTYIKDYSQMLEDDLKELGENQGSYGEKFIEKFSSWMNAKSRCMSSMITGPANFPVKKAQKANNSERKHSDDLHLWRESYFRAVNRIPIKSPEDDKEIAEQKLENLINLQLEVKAINDEIRKSKLTDFREILKHLLDKDFDKTLIQCVELSGGKYKIPSYFLTNNNAMIKATKDKIKAMDSRIERKNTWEDIKFGGGYITIEDDRLKIFHDEKPSKEIMQELKKNGYRYSPTWVCWCRKHTGNSIYSLKFLSFVGAK